RRTGFKKTGGVVGIDAAADVHSARESTESIQRCGFVAGAKHNDVAAGQIVSTVKLGEPASGAVGDKIGAQIAGRGGQGAADDLFDLALVKVDARTEHG